MAVGSVCRATQKQVNLFRLLVLPILQPLKRTVKFKPFENFFLLTNNRDLDACGAPHNLETSFGTNRSWGKSERASADSEKEPTPGTALPFGAGSFTYSSKLLFSEIRCFYNYFAISGTITRTICSNPFFNIIKIIIFF